MRHCATSRKVAGSIPDGVNGFFHSRNPSGRTMAPGSTQPLTEMSTRNISWGKGGRCVGLTTLPPSCADCLEIWEPQPPGTLRAFQACNGIALPLPLPYMYYFIITQNVREILLNTFVPYYVLLITGRMLIFKILKIRISRYRCSYSTSDL